MKGPSVKPTLGPNDSHLIVNDIAETMKAYDSKGKLLWEVPCLARGQGSDWEYKLPRTDTPPGLYKIGTIYNDYASYGPNAGYNRTHMAYGWVTFDLVELENQEAGHGRAGICIHGGGSACGWPGAWAPQQHLYPTFGCVRVYNRVAYEQILPLCKKGTVYVSVYQE